MKPRKPIARMSEKKLAALGGRAYSTITTKRKPIKKKRRIASEMTRVYGPPDRRAWIHSLPCALVAGCRSTPVDICHALTGGMGRKDDHERTLPGCRKHHEMYDLHRPPFDTRTVRQRVLLAAVNLNQTWQNLGKVDL